MRPTKTWILTKGCYCPFKDDKMNYCQVAAEYSGKKDRDATCNYDAYGDRGELLPDNCPLRKHNLLIKASERSVKGAR